MRYLITGGTGFIGSYVVKELLNQGHEMVVFDLQPDANAIQLLLNAEQLRSVHVVNGDVTDSGLLFRTIHERKIERIIHLASLLGPASQQNPGKAVAVNSLGLTNVLDASRFFAVEKVVWASSMAVFGCADQYPADFIGDDAPHYPTTVYGATKSLDEFLSDHYWHEFGVDNTGLRFTIVYGVGRMRGASAFATELMEKAALGQPVELPYGDAVLDWQHVQDVAQALIVASQVKGLQRRVYNTGGYVHSVREVAAIVQQVVPDARIVVSPGLLFDVKFPRLDVSGFRVETGFNPKFDIHTGIRNTISDIRQRAALSSAN